MIDEYIVIPLGMTHPLKMKKETCNMSVEVKKIAILQKNRSLR